MKLSHIFLLALLVFAGSCVKNKKGHPVAEQVQNGSNTFEVLEVVQTSSYTYLRVYENISERWVAVTRMDAKKGDKYYYDSALEMNNFHSKELDRNFEQIFFINKVSAAPLSGTEAKRAMPSNHAGGGQNNAQSKASLEKAEGELKIADVFEKRSDYASTDFEIRGVVVKVNKQVMGKNWIHLQDGTEHNGSFDLTVTSQALPEVNDVVTFKGKLTLNKDFGAGYFYEVIMEDAEMSERQTATTKI